MLESNNNKNLISSHTEDEFKKFILQKFGIVIHKHQIQDLKDLIIKSSLALNCNPEDYLLAIKNNESNSKEIEKFIHGITVGESYFFRDEVQINLIKNKLLPDIINLKRKQKDYSLRIWSAGCSSGEEIYTILILLRELLSDFSRWTLKLLGTDINYVALRKAIAGEFSEWSMRVISDKLKKKYFYNENNKYYFLPDLKDLVHFDYLNLVESCYPSLINGTNSQDLILCRNVLIYFSYENVSEIMDKFSKSLAPHGYLMLGASDPVNLKNSNLSFVNRQGCLFSPKFEHGGVPENKAINLRANLSLKIKKSTHPDQSKKMTSPDILLELMQACQWQKILDILELEKHLNTYHYSCYVKAMALANLGRLHEAEKICQTQLLKYPTDKSTYLMYAMILNELDKVADAEICLRKSLFIDKQFVLAHFQLGLLLLRDKRSADGLRSLNNALTITQYKNENEFVEGSANLTYGMLSSILKKEITIHDKDKGHVYSQ